MLKRLLLTLALGVGLLLPSTASAQLLEPDLAFVRPDAVAFVHVKLADMWKHESMAEMRMLLSKAGPKALAALDEQFVPKPSTADRVTAVVVLGPGGLQSEPGIIAIMHFNEAFDVDLVRASYLPEGKAVKATAGTMYVDNYKNAVYFPNNETLVYSDAETLQRYLALKPTTAGGLAPALALTRTHPFVAAVNVKALPLPPEVDDELPEVFKPLLKTELAILTLDLQEKITMAVNLTFPDAKAADEGHKSLNQAANMARAFLREPKRQAEDMLYGKPGQELPRSGEELPMALGGLLGIAGINYADEILSDLPIKQTNNVLTASVAMPSWATQYLGVSAMSAGLLLPAVQKVRGAAQRAQSQNNLKQILLAMHNYHDATGGLPAAAIVDKRGKPLLSWRVAILPYIEQDNLYRQFHLDEPWDSEHNLPLSKILIKVYEDPRMPRTDGKTYYKAFVGKVAAIDPIRNRKLQEIPDGTSNTMVVAVAGEPVVWTKPDDFNFDPNKPLPDLSEPFGGQLIVGMGDGSVRTLMLDTLKDKENLLKLLIEINDGMVVPEF